MSLMMTGMVGGLGKAALDQSAHLKQQEDADADMTRRKSLESWLMQTRNEYQIESEKRAEGREIAKEGRTDQREIEKDERTWKNEQDRAPTKRDIKAADKTSELDTELGFKTKNRDAISANTKADAEAKVTDADRRLKGAQAESYEANADYTRGAKTAAAAGGGGGGKMAQVDKDELDALQAEIRSTAGNIEKAKLEGTWTGSPEQLKIESGLTAKRLQAAAILRRARGNDVAADPLGKRGAPAAAAPQSIMQSPRSAEPKPDPNARPTAGVNFDDPGLAAGIDNIKDPQERANARQALSPGMRPNPAPRPDNSMQATMDRVTSGGEQGRQQKVDKLKTQIAAQPAAAAPAQGADPLMQALGAAGGGSIDQIVGQQAGPLKAAADAVRQAQQQVVAAAKSGNQASVGPAMQAAAAANEKFNAMLANMNPQQAAQVKKALGL